MIRSLVNAFAVHAGIALLAATACAGDYTTICVPRAYNPELIVPVPVRKGRKCGADYTVPCKRGVAIMSPIESPDRCDYPVGGKVIYTPYYTDYKPDRKHGPRVCVPQDGSGYLCAQPGCGITSEESIVIANSEPTSDFGLFSGASTDEAALKRMGGFADPQGTPPTSTTPDLIDLIQSR